MGQRIYAAIDLKSFYASVECVERGLDPLTANLVVADPRRTEKTICLAVSPSLKRYGLSGRSRLFEVEEKAREVEARTGQKLEYIVAPPRMRFYMDYSARIYQKVYLRYLAPEDIHVYSIDEVFLDLTNYLSLYGMTPHDLVRHLIREVLRETGITATGGIGTNLYLAKIAMDIMAKRAPADEDRVRIAELDEASYRRLLWDHRPMTDFWRVGKGIARRLAHYGVETMGQLARLSLTEEDSLYREFGVDAEILIDHAWGAEACGMAEIKAFRPADNSISMGQVLSRPYDFAQGRVVAREMADQLALELTERGLVTDGITLVVSYDKTGARGLRPDQVETGYYGEQGPKPAHGSQLLTDDSGRPGASASGRRIERAVLAVYDRTVQQGLPIRRFSLSCGHVQPYAEMHAQTVQLDLFTSGEVLEAEREKEARDLRLQQTVADIKARFGRNKMLRGLNFQEGATARERNGTIGGHAAGEGEEDSGELW